MFPLSSAAEHVCASKTRAPRLLTKCMEAGIWSPLSSECGTSKTVKARTGPWLSGNKSSSPCNLFPLRLEVELPLGGYPVNPFWEVDERHLDQRRPGFRVWGLGLTVHCRVNLRPISKARPDSGLGLNHFQNVRTTMKVDSGGGLRGTR